MKTLRSGLLVSQTAGRCAMSNSLLRYRTNSLAGADTQRVRTDVFMTRDKRTSARLPLVFLDATEILNSDLAYDRRWSGSQCFRHGRLFRASSTLRRRSMVC
jgi:hypothetical protein